MDTLQQDTRELDVQKQKVDQFGKPNQLVPFAKKTEDWYRANADYYIRNSWNMSLAMEQSNTEAAMRQKYEIYNNQFPMSWFNHLTNPLNTKNKKYQKFPAKIRPINILRTSIDLLINELSQRPFSPQVVNQGEKAYNDYQENLEKTLVSNMQTHFMQLAQQEAQAQQVQGIEAPAQPQQQGVPQPPPTPDQIAIRFNSSYKDNQAITGQRWLNRTLDTLRFFTTRTLQFKDYLITGYTHSFKTIRNGEMVYERVPPMELRYGKSPNVIYIKDAAWAVRRMYLNVADVVEMFYSKLTKTQVEDIYRRQGIGLNMPFTGQVFFDYLRANVNENRELIPLYHCVWRGKKQVKILQFPDPVTGEIQEMEVDEAYPVDTAAGETATIEYHDEIYETWRILDDIYVDMQPLAVQSGNLPYNGRAFSDAYSANISVMDIGLPFQTMVMIINWTIERTIAKSKGKIMLMDVNAIPTSGDWDEDKFFYYSDALGYMLIDRDNRKVDKSMNQYQVLDMSMYENIKQLIDLQNHYRQMWDDVLGITMPRKGQTYASSSPTNNERSLFQSNIITDNIFSTFEEFINEDLNDMLEYSKILLSGGGKDLYVSDMFDNMLVNVDPVDYCTALIGIMVKTSAKEQKRLDSIKAYAQELLQNGTSLSTLIEVMVAENIAELKAVVQKIETDQAALENQTEQIKAEQEKNADERAKAFAEFKNALDIQASDHDWDRKDQNEIIKGEYQVLARKDVEDANGDGVPDEDALAKRVMEQFKEINKQRIEQDKIKSKERITDKQLEVERERTAAMERMNQDNNRTRRSIKPAS